MINELPAIGFSILNPPLNWHLNLYMLEKLGVTVKLISLYSADDLKVQLWTNTVDKLNSEGDWHPINLCYESQEEDGKLLFTGSVQPTSPGNYQFTYRAALKQQPQEWQWAGKFQENVHLIVNPPSPEMNWTQGPNYVEILPRIYVGNFIAASQAVELGIDAVLNLAREFPLTFSPESSIAYKQLGLLDGAQHPIPDEVLLEAIAWIEDQLQQGKKKILINCRAGIGRSGSVSLAYCFYKQRNWSYQQTLAYIWSQKSDIYPHSHLQESLECLFPRDINQI